MWIALGRNDDKGAEEVHAMWNTVAGEDAMTEAREDIALELARIKRWRFFYRSANPPLPEGMSPRPDGEWVKYDDVDALLLPHVCQERIVFFPEEVLSLNDYQLSGTAHPFTCLCGADLVATTRGWICCLCNYTQDWAHTFMKDGSWRKMRSAMPSAPLSLESSDKK